jgi:hypothetical protein
LLDAALGWLEKGLPLDCIKIVTLRDTQAAEAERIFNARKRSLPPAPPVLPQTAGRRFSCGGVDRGGASDGNLQHGQRNCQPGHRACPRL